MLVGIISTLFHLATKSHFCSVVHLQTAKENAVTEIRVIREMAAIRDRFLGGGNTISQ